MADVPKRIKRLLREYAGAAHEEELRRALLPVSEAFGRWARRELSSGDLSEIIHRFHQGPARELWVRYNTRHLEMPVAFAITTGVLGRETIPAELLEHLAGALRFYEEEQADASGDRGQEFEVQALNQRETSSIGMMATAQVYQFKLALVGVEPPIWRRIQVPEDYSFWDLHVALQDAMGWLDDHLHVFRVAGPGADEVEQIGIPDGDPFEGDKPTLPGWEIPITRHFLRPGTTVPYEYDFGDGWEHELTLEAILPRQAGQKYPLCVDGARACPPEDCGGVHGYETFLTVIQDPTHEEYESTLEWLGGRFDPDRFDPKRVKFDDPARRYRLAFEEPRERAPRRRRTTTPGRTRRKRSRRSTG
jgi:Plasmid pRiA4b ORF-3-like protein